jgi:hypothetical protein
MQCEKCGSGPMQPAKRFRLSGCLVAAGFALVVCSLIATALGVMVAVTGTGTTAQAIRERNEQAKADALVRLEKFPGVPAPVLAEFKQLGSVSDTTLAEVPLDERLQIRAVLVDYSAAVAATGAGGLVAAGVGSFVVIVLLAFGIPGVLVGLLLVRRRQVWRCGACGHGFERV